MHKPSHVRAGVQVVPRPGPALCLQMQPGAQAPRAPCTCWHNAPTGQTPWHRRGCRGEAVTMIGLCISLNMSVAIALRFVCCRGQDLRVERASILECRLQAAQGGTTSVAITTHPPSAQGPPMEMAMAMAMSQAISIYIQVAMSIAMSMCIAMFVVVPANGHPPHREARPLTTQGGEATHHTGRRGHPPHREARPPTTQGGQATHHTASPPPTAAIVPTIHPRPSLSSAHDVSSGR
jgi:hypothetical protein